MSTQNLIHMLQKSVEKYGLNTALAYKKNGHYMSITYRELAQKTQVFSEYLKKLSINKGKTVAILSHNRPEWAISDLAVMSIGAITVPIYPTLSSEEISYILNDAKINCLVIESSTHLERLKDIDLLSTIPKIVFDETQVNTTVKVDLFSDIQSKGSSSQLNPEKIDKNDVASIVYTSGTTGFPKGVELTHNNFVSNVEDILKAIPVSSTDRVLSFLPLSHTFERTTGFFTLLAAGGAIYYAESHLTVAQDMKLAKPTVVISVPRLYEKIQEKIFANLTGPKKMLFNIALQVSKRYHQNIVSKILLNPIQKTLDFIVFKKVRKNTGGKLRFFVSGGAPLGESLARFFYYMGITIIEGYGLTETAPVIACNRLGNIRFGSIGLPLSSLQVKLSKESELLVKGPNIMKGYLNLPDLTKEVIDSEGWFHTGDIAKQDKEGFLYIIDRIKNILVLSNGKKVAPVEIEKTVEQSPHIQQCLLIGEGHNYITALIVPNYSNFEKFSEKEVEEKIKVEINAILQAFAKFKQIKKFTILKKEFTQETGELTPTLKPKRKVIEEKYKSEIEKMYK